MSRSDIGGLKALASHGSVGSSRERALARSLASSIYIHLYMVALYIELNIVAIYVNSLVGALGGIGSLESL